MERLTFRLDDRLLSKLKHEAESSGMQLGTYTRALLLKALDDESNSYGADKESQDFQEKRHRLMIKSSVQVLSLVRFLAAKHDETVVNTAREESSAVIKHLFDGETDE